MLGPVVPVSAYNISATPIDSTSFLHPSTGHFVQLETPLTDTNVHVRGGSIIGFVVVQYKDRICSVPIVSY